MAFRNENTDGRARERNTSNKMKQLPCDAANATYIYLSDIDPVCGDRKRVRARMRTTLLVLCRGASPGMASRKAVAPSVTSTRKRASKFGNLAITDTCLRKSEGRCESHAAVSRRGCDKCLHKGTGGPTCTKVNT